MKLRTRLRILLAALLLAVTAAALVIMFSEQPGYVLISFKQFRYESSLWFFLALLCALWLSFWLLRFFFRSLLLAGGWLNPWSKHSRIRRASRAQQRGLLALVEGRFARALQQLKHAANGEQPLLALLGAARAAQYLGDSEQSLTLLEQARQQCPQKSLATFLVQAELQLQRGELTAARDTLQNLHQQHPKHRHILYELQKILRQQGDWLALHELLPKLYKQGLLSESERLEIEQRACCARLVQAGTQQEPKLARKTLDKLWRTLPKTLREQPLLLIHYAERLSHIGASDEAEQLLQKAIKQRYNSDLVACYGMLPSSAPEYQLKTAESWLKNHSQDAKLLLTLARLARNNGLFGKARAYYEASLSRQANRETCAEFAQVLLAMGETTRSGELFEQILGLLKTDNGSKPSALTLHKRPLSKAAR